MLRQKKPNVFAPANVINSLQALVFDLGPPRVEKKKSSQPDNKSFGKGFTGLRGAFLGNRPPPQPAKKEIVSNKEEFGQGLTGLRGALLSSPRK